MPRESQVTQWPARPYADIEAERDRQRAKFGDQSKLGPFVMLAVLGEEVGEANQAALKARFEGGATPEEFRAELVQCAAVVVQMLEYLDAEAWPGLEASTRQELSPVDWCEQNMPEQVKTLSAAPHALAGRFPARTEEELNALPDASAYQMLGGTYTYKAGADCWYTFGNYVPCDSAAIIKESGGIAGRLELQTWGVDDV